MKTFFRRFLYFGYYIKKLDYPKFKSQLKKAKEDSKKSTLSIYSDILKSSFKYNISILEYFYFLSHLHPEHEYRNTYAGTGFMYDQITILNPKAGRDILEDKIIFLKHYAKFVKHGYVSLKELNENKSSSEKILSNKSGKIVLKNSFGQCGIGVEVRNSNEFTHESLIARLTETGNDFVEEYVVQHDDLMKLSPSGLNTIRIITELNDNGKVDILGCRLRISINSQVDNMAAGNIAAPIDPETGIVNGPGVYSDILKHDEEIHPVTNVKIVGFQVPFWKETLNTAIEAAKISQTNRSIGWDLAVTNNGPELIEGNHDWCKLVWQLPIKKGMKQVLQKYTEQKI